jgi:hypothetical protein
MLILLLMGAERDRGAWSLHDGYELYCATECKGKMKMEWGEAGSETRIVQRDQTFTACAHSWSASKRENV